MGDRINRDEISLIDIISVIIRRRRLILIFLLVIVIVTLFSIYVVTNHEFKKFSENKIYEGQMILSPSSGLKNFLKIGDIKHYTVLTLNDPVVILNALNEAGIKEINNKKLNGERNSQLMMVKSSFIGSVYNVTEIDDDILVKVGLNNEQDPLAFLNALLLQANNRLKELVTPIAEAEIKGFERISSIEYPRPVIEENLMITMKRYFAAMSFLSEEDPGLVNIQSPIVNLLSINKTAIRNNFIKKGIIIIIVAFIFILLLAFILEWIDNVRHDPDSMKKIRAALNRERLK